MPPARSLVGVALAIGVDLDVVILEAPRLVEGEGNFIQPPGASIACRMALW